MSDINPFERLAEHTPEHYVLVLAYCVRTAHQDSDVWASCRTARLLHGCAVDFSAMLYGRCFLGLVRDDESFVDLETMRNYAWEYTTRGL